MGNLLQHINLRFLPPAVLSALATAILLSFLPSLSLAQHEHLTPQEQKLWVEKAVGAPTSHLGVLSERRAQGETTTLNILVILAEFPDVLADQEAHPPEYYEELLFSRGTHPTGSVADFLDRSSNGRLVFTGSVRGWVRLPQPRSIYAGGAGGIGDYPYNSQALAEDAIAAVDTLFNFADIDNEGPDGIPDSGDDDEIVDGIAIIHAGPGREGANSSELTSIMWRTNGLLPVDGVFARFFTLNSEYADIGILIHELGHLMGLPDLYDRVAPPSYGLGLWSMMAGGLAVGNGVYPADFDAYSKTVLGFADVVELTQNTLDQQIIPTQDGGVVYKLWTDGQAENEYFLVEARRQSGLDAYIPGEGLFIYHVDSNLNSNNNPEQYLAALEQADGLYQLEGFYGDFSPGDPGDPFREGDEFSRYTNPGSQRQNRTNTSVAVSNIRGPYPDGSLVADLYVRRTADVQIPSLAVEEATGNGDGILQKGETARIIPELRVLDLDASNVTMTLRPADSTGVVVSGKHQYESIPVSPSFLSEPFEVHLEGPFVENPQAVLFHLDVTWDGSPGRSFSTELGVGTNLGISADFNRGGLPWQHFLMIPGFSDSWFYDPDSGVDGTGAFRCSRKPNGILNFIDAGLESPLFVLPPFAELLVDHKMDLPHHQFGTTLVGGVIEIAINGSAWTTLVPEGGYTHKFIGPYQDWRNRSVFAGLQSVSENPGFQTLRVDLSEYAGSAVRIRFRLVSAMSTTNGEGWIVDNIRVRTDPTPVEMLRYGTEIQGDDLALWWETGEAPLRAVIWRGPVWATATRLGELDSPETASGFLDPGGAKRAAATYWLEFWDRQGDRNLWGPWEVEVRPSLSLTANSPGAGETLFLWTGAPPADSRLEIFDIQGRLVWSVPTGGETAHLWRGETRTGGAATAGVYFARLSGTPLKALKIVRLNP